MNDHRPGLPALPGKPGRPRKGATNIDRLVQQSVADSAAAKYRRDLRYFVLVVGWHHLLTVQGTPVRHLGAYLTPEAARHVMRYCSIWLPHVMVWDRKLRVENAARHRNDLAADKDAQAGVSGVIEFFHVSAEEALLQHTFYQPLTFVQALLDESLP